MSEDAGSLSSAQSRDHRATVQSVEQEAHRVVRTTEKSVVFRVRTQKQVSSGQASNRSPSHTLRLTQRGDTSGTDDRDVNEMLAELYAEVERKKKWLNSEEETFRRGQERLLTLQREHAALLRTLEQYKRRRKERLRIQKMLRDGAKKQRRKLRRFQSDVSLRFQLLQSECRRSDLQVEKLMAELRREYADSCLFGNSLNF
ncbi:Hypothetical protein PHPALM_36896 [Phytophthora palmivora]|uniref:Uncharacterized protein n=1 Tax=Phytophthora palmivora TaxID=4796 RepID=A0A2P4WYT7_9STRA|nr:Hypothetical protein PHPALM_36896 [Phytophthora palmivora]